MDRLRHRGTAPKAWLSTILVAALLVASTLAAIPQRADAYPWGGQFQTVVPCFNAAIWTSVSGPRGGPLIWTPITKTYDYGPPSRAGQYGIGLAAPPYFCIVSIVPAIIVFPGTIMTMLGTSQ